MTVRELAASVESVAELSGWHKPILVALAAGATGAVTSVVDGDPKPERADLTRLLGDRFRGVTGDTVAVDLPPVGLLVVDTAHTADQAYRELTAHHAKVGRYIILHCTDYYGEKGQDGGPGVRAGMRRFLREHPEWTVIKYAKRQYGLLVLSRRDDDKKELPPAPKMAWNFAKSLATYLTTGRPVADEKTIQLRLDTCALCPVRRNNRCSECGCYLDEAPANMNAKAVLKYEQCPLGFWAEAERDGKPVVPLPVIAGDSS